MTKMVGASDERRLDESLARTGGEDADRAPGAHPFRLALELAVVHRLEADRRRCSLHRAQVRQHLACARGTLQPRRRVHHVAGHHPLVRGTDGDRGLARNDAGPRVEVVAKGAHRVDDLETRTNGALGVVLVGDRRAPHRHDRIADKLLDCAAVAGDRLAGALEISTLEGAHLFRVAALGKAREAHEIGEKDADEPPLDRGPSRIRGEGRICLGHWARA